MRAHEFIHTESKFGNFKGGRYRYAPTGKAFDPFDSKNYKLIAQDSGGILSPADVEEYMLWYAEAMGDGLTPEQIAQHADPTDSKFQSLAQVMLLKLSPMQKPKQQKLDEDLRKWFKEKWVRFGPDGKIRGDCARGSESEGKPKCLPQRKAHALGQKGRASAASRKRREDPNPERRGAAKNVATKSKKMKESIDPDLYDDEQTMAPDAIFAAAEEVVPGLKFEDEDTGEGYTRLFSNNGLELHIGVSIIEGNISINIGSGIGLATSGKDLGAVTKIIKAVYDAAVREYGQPDQPGFLVIDHDAGHGVWQRIAQKLDLQYEAHVVKEDGRRMEESLSPKVIHRLADRKGVKWDDEPSFLKKTKQLTGKQHLDDLNQDELKKVKAWLTSLEENFADGRGPGRPGDSARLGIPKNATIAQLEKIRSDSNSSKRKKQLAHWQINMRRGKKKS